MQDLQWAFTTYPSIGAVVPECVMHQESEMTKFDYVRVQGPLLAGYI